MGAQLSTNIAKQTKELVNKSYNKCNTTTTGNTINLKNFKHNPGPECGSNSKTTISQVATADANCVIGALQDSVSSTIAKLKSESNGGFGIATATNISEQATKSLNNMTNECGKLSNNNKINSEDIEVTSCELNILQNASSKSKCEIEALQKIADKMATDMEASATGFLGGTYGIIIFIVVGLVILLGGGFGVYKFAGSKQAIITVIVLIVLIAIVGAVIYFATKK